MLQGLSGWHFLLLLVIILLLFGAPKLPQLAKSLGQSMRIFRGEVDQMKAEHADKAGGATASAQAGVEPSAESPAATAPAAQAPVERAADAGDALDERR